MTPRPPIVAAEVAALCDGRHRMSASWLRSQLAGLKTALAIGSEPLDIADTCRALAAIERGEDWREAVRR